MDDQVDQSGGGVARALEAPSEEAAGDEREWELDARRLGECYGADDAPSEAKARANWETLQKLRADLEAAGDGAVTSSSKVERSMSWFKEAIRAIRQGRCAPPATFAARCEALREAKPERLGLGSGPGFERILSDIEEETKGFERAVYLDENPEARPQDGHWYVLGAQQNAQRRWAIAVNRLEAELIGRWVSNIDARRAIEDEKNAAARRSEDEGARRRRAERKAAYQAEQAAREAAAAAREEAVQT